MARACSLCAHSPVTAISPPFGSSTGAHSTAALANRWYSFSLTFAPKTNCLQDDRFTAVRDGNTLTLTIRDVTVDDADDYLCETSNDAGSDQATTRVLIKHAPVMMEHTTGALTASSCTSKVCFILQRLSVRTAAIVPFSCATLTLCRRRSGCGRIRATIQSLLTVPSTSRSLRLRTLDGVCKMFALKST